MGVEGTGSKNIDNTEMSRELLTAFKVQMFSFVHSLLEEHMFLAL